MEYTCGESGIGMSFGESIEEMLFLPCTATCYHGD